MSTSCHMAFQLAMVLMMTAWQLIITTMAVVTASGLRGGESYMVILT